MSAPTPEDESTWAADLIDGVDNPKTPGQDAGVVAQMRRIAALAAAHRQLQHPQADPQQTAEAQTQTDGFMWGHLRVLGRIGEGSFGTVYRARDEILSRDVALKLLNNEVVAAYRLRSFIEEARRMARVRHPNVLAIHGARTVDGRAGLWCDLLIGETLAEWIDHHPEASTRVRLELCLGMAEAVAAVHRQHLIHGDIKLGNVMVDADGRPILMDFGAGHQLNDGNDAMTSAHAGTPLYMAPEYFREAPLTRAVDVYALGVVMCRLLTGRYRVAANDWAGIEAAHRNSDYLPVQSPSAGLPRALLQLIRHMTRSNPAARPDATAVLQRLQAIRQAPQVRRRRQLLAAVFVALLLGLGGTSWGLYKSQVAQENARLAQQSAEAVNGFLTDMLSSVSVRGAGRDARVADMLSAAVDGLPENGALPPLAQADVLTAVARSYNTLQMPERGLSALNEALRLRRAQAPVASDVLFEMQILKAMLLSQQGRHADVLSLTEPMLAGAPRGSDHWLLAAMQHAAALDKLGQHTAAASEFQSVLSILPRPEDTDNNTGFMVLLEASANALNLGEFERAEALGRRALDWLDVQQKPDEYNRHVALQNLGVVLSTQSRYAEALPLFERAEAMSLKLFGEDNPGHLQNSNNLAIALNELGRHAEALALFEPLLLKLEAVYGVDHAMTLNARNNHAVALTQLHRYEAALAMHLDTLERARAALGARDALVLKIEFNVAELYHLMGQDAAAVRWAQDNVQHMQEVFGDTHLFTLLAKNNLGAGLLGTDRVDEARALYAELVTELAQNYSLDHQMILPVLANHIEALERSGRLQEAAQQRAELLQRQIRVLGEDHPDTRATRAATTRGARP